MGRELPADSGLCVAAAPELLAQAGYAFEVEAADVDESLRAGEAPGHYVQRLAEEKAQAVFARTQGLE